MPDPSDSPEFVIVGHVVRDVVPGGFRVGGTAGYGAVTARNLGADVGVVTSVGPDLDLTTSLAATERIGSERSDSESRRSQIRSIRFAIVPASVTTTFENVYGLFGRRQSVLSCARPLGADDVPAAWRRPRVMLLSPLVREVDQAIGTWPTGGLVAATAQGWLRCWDDRGLVTLRAWFDVFGDRAPAPIIILSEDDVARDYVTVDRIATTCQMLIITNGASGATLYQDGRQRSFPAFPVVERDPTGAGDVFAAAFLVELARSGDVAGAMIYANCAASFAVEAQGIGGCPTTEQVERRLGRSGS